MSEEFTPEQIAFWSRNLGRVPEDGDFAEHRRFVEGGCTHEDAASMAGFMGRGDLFPKHRPSTRAGRAAAARPIHRDTLVKFIELVGEGAEKREAAEALGYQTSARLMKAINQDPELKASFDEAWMEGADPILQAFRIRAVEGWKQEVYQGGKFVGYKQMYDTVAGIVNLKGRDPKYKDSFKADTTVAVQVNFEDRSAAVEDVRRMLVEAGVNPQAVIDGRGSSQRSLPAAPGVLAEPSDV